jgi:outer membrane protein assembly factor BamB
MRDYKVKQNFFGVGAAPLIEGDQLIVVVGAEAGPTVVALDKTTGKQRWVSGLEWTAGYAPPVPATIHGSRMLFVFAGGDSRPPTGGLMVIEAESGKTLSTFPWRGRRYESVNCSSPLIVGERVFISECYGRGGALLDVLPSGELRKVWSNESLNTHFMTAIHKNGYLYGVANHGPQNAPLVCVELATGKEMWRQEPEWEETVQTPQGQRKATLAPSLASMLSVAGKCLLLGYFGHLAWLDLDPKGYKELGRKLLFLATETWTPPSLSRGLLYVCQNSKGFDGTQPRLICYDMRGS